MVTLPSNTITFTLDASSPFLPSNGESGSFSYLFVDAICPATSVPASTCNSPLDNSDHLRRYLQSLRHLPPELRMKLQRLH